MLRRFFREIEKAADAKIQDNKQRCDMHNASSNETYLSRRSIFLKNMCPGANLEPPEWNRAQSCHFKLFNDATRRHSTASEHRVLSRPVALNSALDLKWPNNRRYIYMFLSVLKNESLIGMCEIIWDSWNFRAVTIHDHMLTTHWHKRQAWTMRPFRLTTFTGVVYGRHWVIRTTRGWER